MIREFSNLYGSYYRCKTKKGYADIDQSNAIEIMNKDLIDRVEALRQELCNPGIKEWIQSGGIGVRKRSEWNKLLTEVRNVFEKDAT